MFDTIPMVVDLTRNGEYTQKTNDIQISMLLKYYNSDILISQIDQKIANRNQFDLISPNLIDSFENNFNELRKKYPEDINNITDVRERLYIDIINKIQANCGIIDIVDLGGVNIYDLTSVLYSFFISDYVNNIIKLFANFIFTQRTALYNDLNLDQFKKDKDSSNVHYKKVYNDPIIAVIISKFNYILQSISTLDMSFEQLITSGYYELDARAISILKHVITVNDFYKIICYTALNDPNHHMLSEMKLKLQALTQQQYPNAKPIITF